MVPFTTCAISLFDPSRSEFEYVHIVGRDAERFLRRRLPVSAGITGWVIQHQRPMYNTNPILDLGFLGHEASMEYRTAMVFPLVKNQESLGAIALYSTEVDSYSSEYVLIMEAIVQPASDSVYNALAFEKAQRAVRKDPTPSPAVRPVKPEFDQVAGAPLSVLLVRANGGSRGSSSADERVLEALADAVRQQVRSTDVVARHSADTIIALLHGAGTEETAEMAGRISDAINQNTIASSISLSIGSATRGDHGETLEELLQAANLNCSANYQRLSGLAAPNFKDSFLH
jgi:hypothetical protein